MRTRRSLVVLTASIVVALAFAACGADGGGSDRAGLAGEAPLACASTGGLRHSSGATAVPEALGPLDTPPAQSLSVGTRVGDVAPDFRLRTPCDELVTLSELRGKPVFVNFWATWCGPCRSEMPEIQRIHQRLGGQLQVLAVDLDEGPKEVVAYFRELGLTFTAVLDKGEKVANKYRLFGLPVTYLVDAEGVIRAVRVGPFAGRDELEATLAKVGL